MKISDRASVAYVIFISMLPGCISVKESNAGDTDSSLKYLSIVESLSSSRLQGYSIDSSEVVAHSAAIERARREGMDFVPFAISALESDFDFDTKVKLFCACNFVFQDAGGTRCRFPLGLIGERDGKFIGSSLPPEELEGDRYLLADTIRSKYFEIIRRNAANTLRNHLKS